MKVSVIVPTYRRGNEVVRALNSLKSQTFREFEIVLIDDNDEVSWNEKTEETVKKFREESELSLVYIQNHPNLGSAKSRNKGIAAASGEYITFLDDDDLYLPEKIEKQYEFMCANNLDYSVTDLDLYYDNEKFSDRRTRSYIKQTDKKSLLEYHLMHHIAGTDTMMFKKAYLEKIGGFALIDAGDEFYLMVRAIEGDGKFGYLNRCDIKAYIHKDNKGLSSGKIKIDGENALYEYKKKYFEQLDRKSIKYIKMRHHAVLAFAYLRNKSFVSFVWEAANSLLISPGDCIKLFFERKEKI